MEGGLDFSRYKGSGILEGCRLAIKYFSVPAGRKIFPNTFENSSQFLPSNTFHIRDQHRIINQRIEKFKTTTIANSGSNHSAPPMRIDCRPSPHSAKYEQQSGDDSHPPPGLLPASPNQCAETHQSPGRSQLRDAS
jgi:hypothetical protein